jgi:hypothetical protein
MAETTGQLRYYATKEKNDGTPWYRKRHTDTEPFVLSKLISVRTLCCLNPHYLSSPAHSFYTEQSKRLGNSPFFCAAAFPWHLHSLRDDSLYDISAEKLAEIESQWMTSIGPWIGSVAVGSLGHAWIFPRSGPPLCIQVPHCDSEGAF